MDKPRSRVLFTAGLWSAMLLVLPPRFVTPFSPSSSLIAAAVFLAAGAGGRRLFSGETVLAFRTGRTVKRMKARGAFDAPARRGPFPL